MGLRAAVLSVLVFDNTPLSHFARAGVLPVLRDLTQRFRCVVPSAVLAELLNGAALHPSLTNAVALPWLATVELLEITEVVAFARYKAELGGGVERNNGEAAVLAWTSVHGGTALIDERAATRIARRDDIDVHGTIWLIVNGIRDGRMDRAAAARMVDQLLATDMALPTDGAGVLAWAEEQGLLPRDR